MNSNAIHALSSYDELLERRVVSMRTDVSEERITIAYNYILASKSPNLHTLAVLKSMASETL
jgi:hypothetical protein